MRSRRRLTKALMCDCRQHTSMINDIARLSAMKGTFQIKCIIINISDVVIIIKNCPALQSAALVRTALAVRRSVPAHQGCRVIM